MAPKRRPTKDFTNFSGMRAVLYCRVSTDPQTGESSVDEKSVDDQEREGMAWAQRADVRLGEIFREDAGRSASRFATKARPEFDRLLEHVEADKTDIVWVWAIDRSQRDLRVFAELREVFMRHQVALSVNGKVYDPNDYDGWMLLGITSFFGERYSEELSKNVRRGLSSVASDGRPPTAAPFGYKRRRADERPAGIPDENMWFSKKYRQWVWQAPDTWDGDGRPVEDSPAWVVREVFRRVAAGDGITKIAHDLTDRGIPKPRGGLTGNRVRVWYPQDINRICLQPAYIGKRVHHAEWKRPESIHEAILEVDARWEPLVDEDTFWKVYRILSDPARRRTRPTAAKSLLSFMLTCAKCGGPVGSNSTRSRSRAAGSMRDVLTYSCRDRGCANIRRDKLEDFVEEVMIRWLSDPDIYAALTKVDDSTVAAQARSEANQLRIELEQLYADAEAGEVSPVIATRRERTLQQQISEAEQRSHAATMPDALVGRIGPDAEAKWNSATSDVKRQIIQAVAEITLKPTGGTGRSRNMPVSDRIEWRWLLGPDADV